MKTLRFLILGMLTLAVVMQSFAGFCQSQPSSPVAEVVTPEIQALADGLQDDPLRILNYVHDHIRYVLYFGSKKGAQLTLLEKSGNDFDQSALLVALLRAAGYTNAQFSNKGVGYQFGWMFLPYDSADSRDLHHWLQLKLNNTIWIYTYYYLNDLFYNIRGYPATYQLADGNTYMFQRVWVTLTLGTTNYYLDPAFKISEPDYGYNLPSIMGVSSNALMSAAGGTNTTNSVVNLTEGTLRNTLTGYTTNLLNFLQTNYPGATPQNILGGWQITPSTDIALSNSPSFETYDWSGGMPILNWQYLPTNMMSSLKISFAGTNYQWYVPQLEGQCITLTFDTNGLGQLWQDDSNLVSRATSGTSSSTNVALYINHPYGDWDFTNNVFIDSTYNDRNVTNSFQRTNATYNIMYAFEPDWGWLQERQNQLDNYRAQGLPDSSRQVTSETLNVMGLSWMLQTTYMEQMLAAQDGILPQYYHRLGRMAQESGKGYYVDAYMELPGDYPDDDDLAPQQLILANHYKLYSLFGSAMEHGLIEQLQDTNLSGVSTIKMLEIASTNGQTIYLTGSNNWTAGFNVKSHLTANTYDADTLAAITSLISSNDTILLPQNGSNHIAGPGSWAGYGYAALGYPDVMAISGGYHGGYSPTPITINPPFVQKSGDSQPNAFDKAGTSVPSLTTGDPVDTVDGTFQVEHTDLSLGQAEPRGITVSRYYNGMRRFSNPAGMAGGWAHNYSVSANTVASPQAGLGGTTPAQAAPMMAATCAALTLFNGAVPDPKNWMVTALISKWGIDQLTKNGASVSLGKDTVQFVKQPNGVFTPPANSTMTLTQTNSAYHLALRHGNTLNFDPLGRLTNIVDQYSQPLNVSYLNSTSSLPYQVTDWKSRTVTFGYTSGQLTSVSDGTRTVNYGYSTAYNSQSDLTSFTDAEGKTSTYQYDTNHQITATLDALSRLVITNIYNSQGHITTQYTQGDTNKMWRYFWSGWETVEYDPAGGINGYIYDDLGRLISNVNPLQNESEMVYDGQNHVIYTVTPLLEINQFFYDGNNNLTETIDPLGYTNQFFYDSQNNLIRSVDARGNPSTFGYNAQFSVTGSTNGAGDWVNFIYNTTGAFAGMPASKTDAGGTTSYNYDSYGQLNQITYPGTLGGESFVKNSLGDVTSHTDANANVTAYYYNANRQLTNSTGPTNLVISIAYDAIGNAVRISDGLHNVTSNTWSTTRQLLATALPPTAQGVPVVTNFYDSRDWLVKTLDPYQQPTLFTNDPAGNMISATDPLKRTTTFGYDPDGRKAANTNAAKEAVSQTWDSRGNLVRLTDGAGHFSTRVYDATGNQITLTNRNTNVWRFAFDAANRLTNTVTPLNRKGSLVFNHQGLVSSSKDMAGQPSAFYYDGLGRLTNRTDNLATTVYNYDPNGNQTSVVESGLTNALTYDGYNRVSSYTDITGNLIQYRYDANGNLTNLIYPGNRTVTYFYDSLNRMTNVTDWAGRKTTIAYDLASRVTGITRPNGSYRTLSYDAAGQVTNILEQMANGLPLAWFRFNWTNTGNINWEFAAPLPHVATVATRTMTYDADNQLKTINSLTVTNDGDGNLTYGPLMTNNTPVNFAYDARNRLLRVGGVTNVYNAVTNVYAAVTNIYDAINNRIIQISGTNLTTFVVNPNGKMSQVLMRIKNGVTNYYIYGPGLLYQVMETATGTNTLTYHYDYRGSTVALTDGNGLITDRLEYSLYGLTTYHAGTNDTPFLFNGRYGVQTDSNGLLYMRARYYNPYLCRFVNPDPSGFAGGLNFYAFANGNPVSYLDPFGLNAQTTGDSLWDWIDEKFTALFADGVPNQGQIASAMVDNAFASFFPTTDMEFQHPMAYQFNAYDPNGSVSQWADLTMLSASAFLGVPEESGGYSSFAQTTTTDSRMITVLGSGRGVAPYANRPGFNVLNMDNLPQSEWPRQNALWLNEAITRGDQIWLVTDPVAHANLLSTLPGNPQSFYLNLELPMLNQYSGVNAIPKFATPAR